MRNEISHSFVVGPRKTGTSWIQEYLKTRGDVTLPAGVKETFFFDQYFKKGLRWYKSHFHPTDGDLIVIEVAPTYFENPKSAARIKDAFYTPQVIVTLRDPARRTFSLYQHLKRYGETRLSFRDAVAENNLIEGSLYAKQLEVWHQNFGADNVRVLFTADLANDPQAFADQISDTLNLPRYALPDALKQKFFEAAESPNYYAARVTNQVAQTLRSLRLYSVVNWLKNTGLKDRIFGKTDAAAPKQQLSHEDRQWLLDTWLRADIQQLEKRLNTDLSDWKR